MVTLLGIKVVRQLSCWQDDLIMGRSLYIIMYFIVLEFQWKTMVIWRRDHYICIRIFVNTVYRVGFCANNNDS